MVYIFINQLLGAQCFLWLIILGNILVILEHGQTFTVTCQRLSYERIWIVEHLRLDVGCP